MSSIGRIRKADLNPKEEIMPAGMHRTALILGSTKCITLEFGFFESAFNGASINIGDPTTLDAERQFHPPVFEGVISGSNL